MSTIIVQPGSQAHPASSLDAAARHRSDRLAKATAEDMEKALAFLSVIDPTDPTDPEASSTERS